MRGAARSGTGRVEYALGKGANPACTSLVVLKTGELERRAVKDGWLARFPRPSPRRPGYELVERASRRREFFHARDYPHGVYLFFLPASSLDLKWSMTLNHVTFVMFLSFTRSTRFKISSLRPSELLAADPG